MRTIRYTPPNTDWFVTSRCLQAQHLMRPDAEMTARFGYWLARSLSVYPGIKLRAAVQMSNHYHLVLRDTLGQLSDFMRHFCGNLAKSISGLRDRTGAVFHDRYSASPILDDAGMDARISYTEMNPVRAGLVERPGDWPGVLLSPRGDAQEFEYSSLDSGRRARDRKRKIIRPDLEYERFVRLRLSAYARVKALESENDVAMDSIRKERKGKSVLGLVKILKIAPFSCPFSPKKSRRPICYANCLIIRTAFRARMKQLRAQYANISTAFRNGQRNIEFRAYTFRSFTFCVP